MFYPKSFSDELEKIAASALRGRTQIFGPAKGRDGTYIMKLKDVGPIGHMEVEGGRVTYSGIDKKYQGLGLGKKMYGEVMRRQSVGEAKSPALMSDGTLSEAGAGLWRSMARNPDSKADLPAGKRQKGYKTTYRGKPITGKVKKRMKKDFKIRGQPKSYRDASRDIRSDADRGKELIAQAPRRERRRILRRLRLTRQERRQYRSGSPEQRRDLLIRGRNRVVARYSDGPRFKGKKAQKKADRKVGGVATNYQFRVELPKKARIKKSDPRFVRLVGKDDVSAEEMNRLYADSQIDTSFNTP